MLCWKCQPTAIVSLIPNNHNVGVRTGVWAADFFNADALIAPEITRGPCGYCNGQFLWGKIGRREWCCAVLVHIFGCAIAAPQARRAAMKCLDAR